MNSPGPQTMFATAGPRTAVQIHRERPRRQNAHTSKLHRRHSARQVNASLKDSI